jgi:ethanolamine utilization protein EutQ (cupin superfamily)
LAQGAPPFSFNIWLYYLKTILTDAISNQGHDEIMEVLKGRMVFYLDGKELVTSAGDPLLFIPRGHIHGFTVSTY